LFADGDCNGRTSVKRKRVAWIGATLYNPSDVFELDRIPFFRRNYDFVKFFDLTDLADRSQPDGLCTLDERATG
jgi:hypothetical protein